MAAAVQYVTLGTSNEVFAAPVEKVREILDMCAVSRLPRMPPHMLGMIDVRGQTVPLVDLSLTLGLERADDTPQTRIVVMTIAGGVQATIAIRTDRVFEVASLDAEALEDPISLGGQWSAHCVAGIGRRNGSFVTVLDFDRLLDSYSEVAM